MLSALLASGVTILASYLVLQPNIKNWSIPGRGFKELEPNWGKAFLVSYIVASLTGFAAWLSSDYNTYVAFIVITIFTLAFVAAWSDANVYKVPSELSNLTIGIAFVIMVSFLASANVDSLTRLSGGLMPYVPLENFWLFAGVSSAVALVSFLGFIKIKANLISMLCLWTSFSAVFLIGYALLSGLARLDLPTNWAITLDSLLLAYIFLSVIALFDLFLSAGIGGADIKLFYAIGFAFAFWVTAYNLFIALLVGFTLQLLIHLVAKPLKIGYPKQVKNGLVRSGYLKASRKIKSSKNKELLDVAIPTHYVSQAVPFVPALVLGFAGSILVLLSVT